MAIERPLAMVVRRYSERKVRSESVNEDIELA
jgi:hypothetical protein